VVACEEEGAEEPTPCSPFDPTRPFCTVIDDAGAHRKEAKREEEGESEAWRGVLRPCNPSSLNVDGNKQPRDREKLAAGQRVPSMKIPSFLEARGACFPLAFPLSEQHDEEAERGNEEEQMDRGEANPTFTSVSPLCLPSLGPTHLLPSLLLT
jgi:hypothetical protein